jgi:hypothetical protein
MALLTLGSIDRTGLATSGGAAATATTGDTFPNDGNTLLVIANGSASPITASITINQKVDGVTPAAKTVAIAASTTVVVGPFPPATYNDPATSLVTVVCSAVTTVTLKAARVSAT